MTLRQYHRGFSTLAALIALFAIGCSRGGVNSAESPLAIDRSSELAKVNPCSLLTSEEIAAQVDLTLEPSQREASRQLGTKHQISSDLRQGAWPVCRISWRSVDSSGQKRYQGEFQVPVMSAQQLEVLQGENKRKKNIGGIGDEAFHDGYQAYARARNLVVGIEEFPDTYEGDGRIELLRAAVRRLP